MEQEWGEPFVHESGHALIAVLEGIPCHGICFERGEGTGKFCALIAPTAPGQKSRSNYTVSSAGSAAEQLIYGSYDQEAAAADRKTLTGPMPLAGHGGRGCNRNSGKPEKATQTSGIDAKVKGEGSGF